MKETDGRGKHGRQGRKATGRVRNEPFSGKFTKSEIEEIKEVANENRLTQSCAVMEGIRKLKEIEK